MTSAAPARPAADQDAPQRRERCRLCGRVLIGCWCACVHRADNLTPLLLLQHPDEVDQIKGTTRLLEQCLSRVERRVGEQWPAPASVDGLVLLYPDTPHDPDLPTPAPWPNTPVRTLVAIDGTWRKSRRMLHLNPWLAALPRLKLTAVPPSRYAIRRARGDDQRSTLEACALGLAQLDQDHERYAPLWDSMDAFVALQQRLAREGRAHREALEARPTDNG